MPRGVRLRDGATALPAASSTGDHSVTEPKTRRATAAAPATVRHYIDGRYVEKGANRTFENRSPVDGTLVSLVAEAGTDEVDAAVAAAKRALHGPWAGMSVADRSKLLHAVADEIDRRFEDFVAAEVADTGMPESFARSVVIPRGAANFRFFADLVKNLPAENFHLDTPDGAGALNYVVRGPKGVIAVICPWNLPLLLTTWKLGPALACGNSVVVKPSEETPSSAALLGEVMGAAGVPDGVVNVVHGFGPGSAGELLTRHRDIDAVTFTGESATGEAIMKAAAVGLRDVSFELGGKNPGIVFADCNLDRAIAETTRSTFANCGQICLATERLYVERPVFDAFVEGLAASARALRLGHPGNPATRMGPLISHAHRNKVMGYYERARTGGAEIVTGGGIPDLGSALAGGSWIEPTIWTGLDEDSAVVREEIFGPCCHIRPFDDPDEAVALANDTGYGLACTLWTENASRAHRLGRRIDAGIVWVNSWFLRDLRTPFGGTKRSGIGREGGARSLDFYTETRNVCVKL